MRRKEIASNRGVMPGDVKHRRYIGLLPAIAKTTGRLGNGDLGQMERSPRPSELRQYARGCVIWGLERYIAQLLRQSGMYWIVSRGSVARTIT